MTDSGQVYQSRMEKTKIESCLTQSEAFLRMCLRLASGLRSEYFELRDCADRTVRMAGHCPVWPDKDFALINLKLNSEGKRNQVLISKTCLPAVKVLLHPPLLQVCIIAMWASVWDWWRSDLAVDTLLPRGDLPRGGGVSAV